MPLTLRHETAPAIALNVARTKRFSAGSILGDSGLNVEIVGHPMGPYHPDQAEHTGAHLILEWSGPIRRSFEPHGYPPDIFFDQHPHRVFVPVGTTCHLRLTGVELDAGTSWQDSVIRPTVSLGSSRRAWLR